MKGEVGEAVEDPGEEETEEEDKSIVIMCPACVYSIVVTSATATKY